uniref:Sushi domain-containing protein n=1 Tax=Magallana gigas TaxID=29159 RepID=A0A8W8N1Y4_MAGGI|nr:uncharacterized protein LOC105333199 [Crassostrea gigas]
MLRGIQHFISLFTILMLRELNCQICNLGMDNRNETNLSSVYHYGYAELTADKALNGNYSIHHTDCAGSANDTSRPYAWWQVTFKSVSKIFKINLIFREMYYRHVGYYVFITNHTVKYDQLSGLDPVYHDNEANASFQNTIVFPGGYYGRQLYLFVNHTKPSFMEPCEVEIFGCVTNENVPGCNCSDATIDNQELVLWDSRIAFGNGTVTLHCYKYYLSIMNLTSQTESELESILEACDGKQHCTIPTSQNLKYNTINFYCTDRCVNEAYNNTIFVSQLMTDSGIRYHRPTEACIDFTAFLKSRELNCSERYVLTNGNLTLQCQREGQWIGEAPVCNVTCQEPIHDNITMIRHTHPSPNYFADYSVTYTCRKNHRIVEGNLTRVCNKSGDWTEDKPVCKRCECPCERLKSQNFITDPQVLQNRIKEMEKELKINEKALSATVRKKTCAKDERKSAKGIGSVLGIGIIVFVVSIIVCSDIPILYRHIRYGP